MKPHRTATITVKRSTLFIILGVIAVATAAVALVLTLSGSNPKEAWISAVKDAGYVPAPQVSGGVYDYDEMWSMVNLAPSCGDLSTIAEQNRMIYFDSPEMSATERHVRAIGSTPEQAIAAYVEATDQYVCEAR